MSHPQNDLIREDWAEYRENWLFVREFTEKDVQEDEIGEYVEIEMVENSIKGGEDQEMMHQEREYLPFIATKKGLAQQLEYAP